MRLLGKFSRQTLIARVSCHLHVFIYITHLTKIPTWKLFSLWVKKVKKRAQRQKEKLYFVKQRKKHLAESDKGSRFGETAEDPESSKTLLAQVLPLPLPLASLPIITWTS